MFTTSKPFRHPLSSVFGGEDFDIWHAVEVELRSPWFLLELSPPANDSSECRLLRTILVAQTQALLDISRRCQAEGGKIKSAALVLPPTKHQSEAWSMHPLRAIWQANEPSNGSVPAYVVERQDGLRYVDSRFKTAEERLVDIRQVLKLGVVRRATQSRAQH